MSSMDEPTLEYFITDIVMRRLVEEEHKTLVRVFEPLRSEIERVMLDFDEESQSWRSYRNMICDNYIPRVYDDALESYLAFRYIDVEEHLDNNVSPMVLLNICEAFEDEYTPLSPLNYARLRCMALTKERDDLSAKLEEQLSINATLKEANHSRTVTEMNIPKDNVLGVLAASGYVVTSRQLDADGVFVVLASRRENKLHTEKLSYGLSIPELAAITSRYSSIFSEKYINSKLQPKE